MSSTSCSGFDLLDRSHVAVAEDPSVTSSLIPRRQYAPAPGPGHSAWCDGRAGQARPKSGAPPWPLKRSSGDGQRFRPEVWSSAGQVEVTIIFGDIY
jgi:hypothetical protein